MQKKTTTILTAVILSLIVGSNIATADKIKEVIISEQSAPIAIKNDVPIQVELEPGGFVYTAPIPTVPAQVKGFRLGSYVDNSEGSSAGEQNFIVIERDSIIKFVNVGLSASPLSNDLGTGRCDQRIYMVLSPLPNVPVSEIPLEDRITLVLSSLKKEPWHLSKQFATGDILLPKGSVIINEVVMWGLKTCGSLTYGILFEQD